MHGGVINIIATDTLGLKHQDISVDSADCISMALVQFHVKILRM